MADQPKPKLDVGPEKPKKMLSWEGAFYVMWNWKTYLFYAVWIVCVVLAFLEAGIVGAIGITIALWVLRLIGKFL